MKVVSYVVTKSFLSDFRFHLIYFTQIFYQTLSSFFETRRDHFSSLSNLTHLETFLRSSCLGHDIMSIFRLTLDACSMADMIHNCFHNPLQGTKAEQFIKWNSFNISRTFINVDGSCLDNPFWTGFGGVICNVLGMWHAGFSSFISGSFDIL